MDKKCCIIFPNQLFRESIFIDSDYKIFLIEEDLFFNQYNFHKQKISFHRSSMKFYQDYLIKKGLDVSYVNSYDKESSIIELIKNISIFGCCDAKCHSLCTKFVPESDAAMIAERMQQSSQSTNPPSSISSKTPRPTPTATETEVVTL